MHYAMVNQNNVKLSHRRFLSWMGKNQWKKKSKIN
jgi:hypothetical protein